MSYVLSVIDELTEELIREGEVNRESGWCSVSDVVIGSCSEKAILARYEESVKFDENSLCAAIESISTDDVICPVCQK